MLIFLLGLFILLQIADAALTIKVLGLGGREMNKALRWLMVKLGVTPALAVLKAIAIVSTAVAVYVADPFHIIITLLALDVIYVYVAVTNYNNWKNLREKVPK